MPVIISPMNLSKLVHLTQSHLELFALQGDSLYQEPTLFQRHG